MCKSETHRAAARHLCECGDTTCHRSWSCSCLKHEWGLKDKCSKVSLKTLPDDLNDDDNDSVLVVACTQKRYSLKPSGFISSKLYINIMARRNKSAASEHRVVLVISLLPDYSHHVVRHAENRIWRGGAKLSRCHQSVLFHQHQLQKDVDRVSSFNFSPSKYKPSRITALPMHY